MPWDPNQYHKFQAHRSAPFYDLLALVEVRPNLMVVDQGCPSTNRRRSCSIAELGIFVFEKVYAHILADSDAVVEWISGTACVPYFERLGELKDEYLKAIGKKMHAALPQLPVFYPFRRTLFTARKPH